MSLTMSSSVGSNVAIVSTLNFVRPEIQLHDLDKKIISSTLSGSERRDINRRRRLIETKRYGGRESHQTIVSSRGFNIDSNILELIEALWEIGFETQFSCEGEAACFDPSSSLDNGQWGSHIIFPHMIHAVEFMEASYNHLMRPEYNFDWPSVISLKPMLSMGYPAHVRAIVIFNPSALETLTEFWKTLANKA